MAYECTLLKPALRFLDKKASPDEIKRILEIIEAIRDDPHIDGKTKFVFSAAPLVFYICKVEEWWVIYHRPDLSTIRIVNVGRVSELPDIRRP
jgi:hypothetical protein